MLSLPYACTRPCGPKPGLLAPSSARFSVDKRCRLCKGLGSLLMQLPTASGQHCASTQLKALRRPADQLIMSAVAELPCRSTLALDQRIVDRRRSTERRLHFDSPTHIRVNSDSCVNDGYCLGRFGVDTAPSTCFSPFPSRTLPRSTRTMTDSGQLRWSISLPGYHVDFFYFRGARQL